MTKGVAIVARPDSVTHLICPRSPDEAVTHHMIGTGPTTQRTMRCRYCHLSEAELRMEHEL
jgi:histone acetyltransferase (RNA polymerase elongator complex component)